MAQVLNYYFVGSVEDIASIFKTSVWSGQTIAAKTAQLLELNQISKSQAVKEYKQKSRTTITKQQLSSN